MPAPVLRPAVRAGQRAGRHGGPAPLGRAAGGAAGQQRRGRALRGCGCGGPLLADGQGLGGAAGAAAAVRVPLPAGALLGAAGGALDGLPGSRTQTLCVRACLPVEMGSAGSGRLVLAAPAGACGAPVGVSDSPPLGCAQSCCRNLVPAVQATEDGTGPELPLAAPSAANWLLASLPPGNVSVIVYVRYADSAVASPLGLPAGARLQVRA